MTVTPTAPPRVVRRIRWDRVALGLVVPVLLLLLWQGVTSAGLYSSSQLAPPAEVLAALRELLQRDELWSHLAISIQRVLLGFASGALIALILGAVVGLFDIARLLLAPTVGLFRTVPSLAWVPLLLLWLGIGEEPKIVLVAIGAFFPIYTTTASALSQVDPHLTELGRAYGLHRATLLFSIQLPAVAPAVVNGLRLGLANGWLFLVAAELIASSKGLGFLLIDSQNSGRTDIMLLAIVLLALLGKISDTVFAIAETKLIDSRF